MLNVVQFTNHVIKPSLYLLQQEIPYSEEAVQLLLGTALQESKLTFLKQLGEGPALGLFQMEPDTFNDIFTNFLAYKPGLLKLVQSFARTTPSTLITDASFACIMARIHYFRKPGAIPKTLAGQAQYWKQHYNSYLGAGSVEEYLETWVATFGDLEIPNWLKG